jgi:hypothetical protein
MDDDQDLFEFSRVYLNFLGFIWNLLEFIGIYWNYFDFPGLLIFLRIFGYFSEFFWDFSVFIAPKTPLT